MLRAFSGVRITCQSVDGARSTLQQGPEQLLSIYYPSGQNHRRHVDGMEKHSHEKGQACQGTQGDVYESLLSEIASAGKNGQFRIPSSPYRFRIQIRI